MSEIQNTDELVTKSELSQFYQGIYPYLNGAAHAGFTPVGTVISVMGVSAPANYLACNGQTVNIADYPELANYFEAQFGSKNKFGGDGTTTFAVPDLRGEFLRGTGTNSHANQGSGANVGVHQDGTEHSLIMPNYNSKAIDFTSSNSATEQGYSLPINSDIILRGNRRIIPFNDLTVTSSENHPKAYISRPTNTSVLYCIATKNIYIDARYNYSLEEQEVGTWIDGKPLYQKTIVYDLSTKEKPASTSQGWYELDNLSTSILNIDKVFIQGNSCLLYNNTFAPVSMYQDSTNNIFFVTAISGSTRKLNIKTNGDSWFYNALGTANSYLYLTIQYTKTTD